MDTAAELSHLAGGDGHLWAVRAPDGVVEIDPASGRLLGRPIPIDGTPIGLAVAGSDLWVAASHGRLFRVDPRTHQILSTVPVHTRASALAVGDGAVWVATAGQDKVIRVDPVSERVVDTIHMPHGPIDIRAGPGGIWVQPEIRSASLYRIDPSTDRITNQYDAKLEAIGRHAIWVAGPWAPNGGLRRIDPMSMEPEGPTIGFDIMPISVGVGGGQVWVGRYFYYCKLHNPIPEGPPIVAFAWFRIDPESLEPLSAPTFVDAGPGRAVYAQGSLWIALGDSGGMGLLRLDEHEAGSIPARPTPGLSSPTTATS